MNDVLNDAVIKAVKETFKAVIGSAPQNSPPTETKMNGVQVDTSVIISFVGEVSGVFTLRCSKEFGAKIASQMLGIEISADSDDMKDAIGEMFNMIVGAIKSFYSADTDPFKISVPTTVIGEDYQVQISAGRDPVVSLIAFTYGSDEMSIEVFLS